MATKREQQLKYPQPGEQTNRPVLVLDSRATLLGDIGESPLMPLWQKVSKGRVFGFIHPPPQPYKEHPGFTNEDFKNISSKILGHEL